MTRKSWEERLEVTDKPLLRKLFRIMIDKQSNLCVAVNFKTIQEVLHFVDVAGKHIVMLKVQCHRMKGDSEENLRLLSFKKKQHNFLIFVDHKFNDTGETTKSVYESQYVRYADLVTVAPFLPALSDPYRAIDLAIQETELDADEHRGCIAVCEVSYAGVSQSNEDSRARLACATASPACVGIVAQELQVSDYYNMIKLTPGVHIGKKSDGLGQNWKHPSDVMALGSDIIIVGRGIVSEPEDRWEEVSRCYREISYSAYLNTIKK